MLASFRFKMVLACTGVTLLSLLIFWLVSVKVISQSLSVAYSLADVQAAIAKISFSFALLIPVTLILLAGSGAFLVSRFLRPLIDLHHYLDMVMHQPLNEELPVLPVQMKDEIGDLMSRVPYACEKMRNSLRQMLGFSSLASHELRTPLTVLRHQLESALRPQMSIGILRETLVSTYDEILRLNRMVEDFLNLATIQAGTFRLERRRAGLHVLLSEFYDDALFISREKGVAFVMAPGPKVFVEADVIRIREVLFNLFDNAIKHTPAAGSIRLGYEVQDQEVVLQFADSGSGIPQNELPRIFNFFDKGHASDHDVHGAGLGLALVKCIVEAHHGTIAVDSELNKGTTFTIRLPVA